MTPDAMGFRPRRPRLRHWVRVSLVLLVLGWTCVFAVAAWIYPYREDGTPLRIEAHRQLGLPECQFKKFTGTPCPSCGMTTSFALLVRGDIWNSLLANFAGTALALFGMAFIPWALATALAGRVVWLRSVELTLFRLCIVFLILLLGHWGLALLLTYYG
jgi:hypothetical protein